MAEQQLAFVFLASIAFVVSEKKQQRQNRGEIWLTRNTSINDAIWLLSCVMFQKSSSKKQRVAIAEEPT